MHAITRRFVVLIVLTLLTVPALYYGVSTARAPELYAEDRLETRDCRICGGSGTDEELARDAPELGSRCRFCGGDGKVEVILPGPHHPTRLKGIVVAAPQVSPLATYRSLRPRPGPQSPGSRPFPAGGGGISGARLSFRGPGGRVDEVASNRFGLLTLKLAPGTYRVTVSALGLETLEGDLEVPVLTEPIWLEQARLIREPETAAEARSLHGLEAVVRLEAVGQGSLQVGPGSP